MVRHGRAATGRDEADILENRFVILKTNRENMNDAGFFKKGSALDFRRYRTAGNCESMNNGGRIRQHLRQRAQKCRSAFARSPNPNQTFRLDHLLFFWNRRDRLSVGIGRHQETLQPRIFISDGQPDFATPNLIAHGQ